MIGGLSLLNIVFTQPKVKSINYMQQYGHHISAILSPFITTLCIVLVIFTTI